jgi:hypothetical protein
MGRSPVELPGNNIGQCAVTTDQKEASVEPKQDQPRKFKAELNAVALLLCTPSDLNLAWTTCSKEDLDVVIRTQLNPLPFSSEVRDRAEHVMRQLHVQRETFARVANQFRLLMWTDGVIPHPEPQTAQRIIQLMKDLPDE